MPPIIPQRAGQGNDRGIELAQVHRVDAVSIEEAAFQQLLQSEWNRQARAARLLQTVHVLATENVNKETRIRRLSPAFAQRRFTFNPDSPGAKILVNQLRDFLNGRYDGGPDALEQAHRLASLQMGENINAGESCLLLESMR